MTRLPNFFLIGAPKCGTTSIAAWLAEHPEVFMCEPKEPDYFDTDRVKGFEVSHDRYMSYFAGATSGHLVVGEASTGYLRSGVAVAALLEFAPGARVAVGLRNPIDMAFSWHGQAVFESWESERDFERAWRLQDDRRRGLDVPARCRNVGDLLYGDVCLLGAQLQRVVEQVPADRLFVYTVDELRDPGALYGRLLAFLGVSDDGRAEFPIHNVAREVPRWVAVVHRGVSDGKRRVGLVDRGFGLVSGLTRRFARQRSTELTPALRSELADYFREDVSLLSELVGRDLSGWLDEP